VTPQIVHIEIDVGIDGDQIAGYAGDGVSLPRPFLDWLGLISELDRLMAHPVPARSPAPSRTAALEPGTPERRWGT